MGSTVARCSSQDLLAHAHNRMRATVDTGGVLEPPQPCHIYFQLAQVPCTPATVKLLQRRAHRGKLLAVALEDPAQSVEIATGPDRFQLPIIGTGFPEPDFQCREFRIRRLGTRMFPFVQTFPILRRQDRWNDRVETGTSRIQHAAGSTDVRQCHQTNMQNPKTGLLVPENEWITPSPNGYTLTSTVFFA